MIEIPPDWLDTTIRLLLATLLASVIGMEREVRNKPAGLRTHMLVGLGSAAFTVFSLNMATSMADAPGTFSFDPLRIIGAVIGGLGFLGAGAIIQSHGDVHGMTTAAGIWIVGAIGVGCGAGGYFAVAVATAIAVVCLIPVRFLEHKFAIRNPEARDDD